MFAIVVVRRKATGNNNKSKNTPTPELRWENPKEGKLALIEARETEEEECRKTGKIPRKQNNTNGGEREREKDGTTKVDQKILVEIVSTASEVT